MDNKKIGKSLILAGFFIMVIGAVIYLFEEEETKNIKELIKEADKIIKNSTQ